MVMNGLYEEESPLRLIIAGAVALTGILLFLLLALGPLQKSNMPDPGPFLEVDYVAVEDPPIKKAPPPPPRVTPQRPETPELQPPEPAPASEVPELETAAVPSTAADIPAPTPVPVSPTAVAGDAPLRIVSPQELDNVAFEPIVNPPPAYPPVAQSAGITGYVDVDLVIADNGKVRSFSIVTVKGHPAFGVETARVLPKWRFPPPRIKGEKTTVRYLYRIRFTLNALE